MYAKLINGVFTPYNPPIIQDGIRIYPHGDTQMLRYGYKKVITSTPPETEEGEHAEPFYTEDTTTITQGWVIVQDEPTAEERLEAQVYFTAVMTDTLIEDEEDESDE